MKRTAVLAAAACLWVCALVALALYPAPARAGMFAFMTPTGAMTGGGPVNAEADLTTSAGSILVTLRNLQANPKDVAQLLSDFSFTVGGGGR